MTAAAVGALLLLLLLLGGAAAGLFFLLKPKPGSPPAPTPPPGPPGPPSPPGLKLGHYGALTDFSGPVCVDNVKQMLGLGVLDFQYFDWAANYSGIFQAFQRGKPSKDPPGWWSARPYWWRSAGWADTYFGTDKVDAQALKASIKTVRDAGGRPWAYVQAQTSEFLNLAGTWCCCNKVLAKPSDRCGQDRVNDPQTIEVGGKPPSGPTVKALFPFFAQGEQQALCKFTYRNDDGDLTWPCQEGVHELPAYFLNGPLARYQCNAWAPIVKELGFYGIHWDIFSIAGAAQDENAGVAEFIRVAGELLAQQGLRQTFNNVSRYYPWSLFSFGLGGSLLFPYAETWKSTDVEAYAAVAALNPGAVAAWYTGGKPFLEDQSCCGTVAYPKGTTAKDRFVQCNAAPNTPLGEPYVCAKYVEGQTPDCQYGVSDENQGKPFNCPPNAAGTAPMTQAQLSAHFWKTCCADRLRLLILVDGSRQLRQDYFRDSSPLSPELKQAIAKTQPCGPTYLRSLTQPLELAFAGEGLLVQAEDLAWSQAVAAAKTAADLPLIPAYTLWQQELPLSMYRQKSVPGCSSMALAFDLKALKDLVLCSSSVDRDSFSRVCCACAEDVSWCSAQSTFAPLRTWDSPPTWTSPYCKGCAKGDLKCRQAKSGCGAHVFELKQLCPDAQGHPQDWPGAVASAAGGKCAACGEVRWDAYATQALPMDEVPPGLGGFGHGGKLVSPGVQSMAYQSIYRDLETMRARTKAFNQAFKAAKAAERAALKAAVPAIENEVSIYIDPTAEDYAAVHKRMMDALLCVFCLQQDCATDDDRARALKLSCDAAVKFSQLLGRTVPCVAITYEAEDDLSLFSPPIKSLAQAPYNMNVLSCP